jgi:hypothetical protein
MRSKTTIRVVEIKTPHPRQFERVVLMGGALLRLDEMPAREELDLIIRIQERLVPQREEPVLTAT